MPSKAAVGEICARDAHSVDTANRAGSPHTSHAEAVGRASGSLASLSDQELLAGIRASSEAHFSELYNRYFQRIYGFVYARMHNHADAEEVVQEIFTAVFRVIDSYRGQSSLLSWIYGIAKNMVNGSLRRARMEGERMDAADPAALRPWPCIATCTPEDQLNMRRYMNAIRERFESMADWQSEIFAMRHMQNLSIREIARRTDRSSDAIRSSLYRMKRTLYEAADLSSNGVIS